MISLLVLDTFFVSQTTDAVGFTLIFLDMVQVPWFSSQEAMTLTPDGLLARDV